MFRYALKSLSQEMTRSYEVSQGREQSFLSGGKGAELQQDPHSIPSRGWHLPLCRDENCLDPGEGRGPFVAVELQLVGGTAGAQSLPGSLWGDSCWGRATHCSPVEGLSLLSTPGILSEV